MRWALSQTPRSVAFGEMGKLSAVQLEPIKFIENIGTTGHCDEKLAKLSGEDIVLAYLGIYFHRVDI